MTQKDDEGLAVLASASGLAALQLPGANQNFWRELEASAIHLS